MSSAVVSLISPGLPGQMGNALYLLIRMAIIMICPLSPPPRAIITHLFTMTAINAKETARLAQAMDAIHLVNRSPLKASQSGASNWPISGPLGLAALKHKYISWYIRSSLKAARNAA